ncbi:hypothetical protein KAI04_04035 [Candidatus Pacearchaeota archaeon]|nr:hypothetical protein [Candidatus Pacearchaeota archaeon]
MKCKICEQDYKIKTFIPKGKDGNPIFTYNLWFFAYCQCKCGEFIINKEQLIEDD